MGTAIQWQLLFSGLIAFGCWRHTTSGQSTVGLEHESRARPVSSKTYPVRCTEEFEIKAAPKSVASPAILANDCGALEDFFESPIYAVLAPRNVYFTLEDAAISQIDGFAPGTVVLAIRKSGVKKWFATNTAALVMSSGSACVVDGKSTTSESAENAELTTYFVIDGNHLRLVLKKPHISGATVVVGGGCQYEPDQDLDSNN